MSAAVEREREREKNIQKSAAVEREREAVYNRYIPLYTPEYTEVGCSRVRE